jgi:hypothetical protein
MKQKMYIHIRKSDFRNTGFQFHYGIKPLRPDNQTYSDRLTFLSNVALEVALALQESCKEPSVLWAKDKHLFVHVQFVKDAPKRQRGNRASGRRPRR